jgi:hypothetical protein
VRRRRVVKIAKRAGRERKPEIPERMEDVRSIEK